jgi:hypothetical protein
VLDQSPGGGWAPGGPALYAARTALALGCRVELVSGLPPDYPRGPLGGLSLKPLPAADVPRYVNTYDPDGKRSQRLLTTGAAIRLAVPPHGEIDVLILAPAFDELEGMPPWPAGVRAMSLQGVLRDRDGDRVVPRADAWAACEPFVVPGAFYFLSDEDTREPAALARRIAAAGGTCFVTYASEGATRYAGAAVTHRPAFPATAIEPTGAGDVFATSFAVRLAECGDGDEAWTFALMAGALAVEGAGLDGVPQRAAIEARLARVAA